MVPSITLLDLPPELLERILFHVADPPSLRAAALTCTRLAAATAASSPLWPALLSSRIDLSRRPGPATGWEWDFYCYWDETFGDPTDEVAFSPPLGRVRGFSRGEVKGPTSSAEGSSSGDGAIGGTSVSSGVPAAPDDEGNNSDGAAADQGGGGAATKGGFLYTDNRQPAGRAAAASPDDRSGATAGGVATSNGDAATNNVNAGPPNGLAGASGGDSGGKQPTAKRLKTATVAPAAAARAAAEDPRLLYAALVAATHAGDAVSDPAFSAALNHSMNLWGSEAAPIPHVWVVRVDPPGIPWPPCSLMAGEGAPTADPSRQVANAHVVAAASALLIAAGATPPVVASVSPTTATMDQEPPGTLVWSGLAADAIFTRHVGGPIEAVLGQSSHWDAETMVRFLNSDVRRRVAAGNAAVRGLLGSRPALLFEFGEEEMNPVGAVLAAAWSPQLIVGLLLEVART
ncbi:hypothetical protein MMPV_005891 [Pyropia vietnamensis]